MREVFKMPLLVEHFISHKTENPEISFSYFMDLHYFTGHEKDADYDRDMQLPFKSTDCNHLALNTIPLPSFFSFKVEPTTIFMEKQNNFSYFDSISMDNIHTIFRPPIC